MSEHTIVPIAVIRTDFPEPFGIPRQPAFCKDLRGTIIFEPQYRKDGILKGLDAFTHLWLIFGFHQSNDGNDIVTVRPPKLGGTERVGVFASRAPIRPNGLGLSAVKIEAIRLDETHGMVIEVSGCDLVDQTPIYDIKPYIPYSDSIPEASNGFACMDAQPLNVSIEDDQLARIPKEKQAALLAVLRSDPRPGFHHERGHIYRFAFAGHTISFQVIDDQTVIVTDIT